MSTSSLFRWSVTLALAVLLPALAVAQASGPAAPSASASGIPYANVDAAPRDLVEAIRARRANGELLNLDRMLLHSPAFAKAWNGMFGAIRGQLAVPPKLRELAIMAIGVLNDAEYEWAQHEGEFLKAGGTQAQLAALRKWSGGKADPKLFDEPEQATLALTAEMTRNVKVSRATLERVRALLPDAQVVELAGAIAGYNMVSRFVVATGVQIERREPADSR
jgi:alkylhydroperoxidase family enzyme